MWWSPLSCLAMCHATFPCLVMTLRLLMGSALANCTQPEVGTTHTPPPPLPFRPWQLFCKRGWGGAAVCCIGLVEPSMSLLLLLHLPQVRGKHARGDTATMHSVPAHPCVHPTPFLSTPGGMHIPSSHPMAYSMPQGRKEHCQ